MSQLSKTGRTVLVCFCLVIVTLTAFWPVIYCEFVNYDDPFYVLRNPHVQQGVNWDSVRWAFTSVHASNWHPLTWISHMLDWQLFGADPSGHHAVNLAFHVVNTALLFLLLQRITHAVWPSALVAALFGIHPLHVESVAWIAERKDVLSTFFWILAIWAYARYCEKRGWRRYAWVVAFFILGLMSKPMVVTLPFLLLLLDFWPLNRTPNTIHIFGREFKIRTEKSSGTTDPPGVEIPWSRLLTEKAPLLALAFLSSLITLHAQSNTVQPITHFPLMIRLCNAVLSYGRYIFKMLWPAKLSVHYPYIYVWPFWGLVAYAVILFGISFMAVRKARRYPYLFVGWFWFIGTLVPTIGLIQVGTQAMADRYSYVPLLGLFIVFAWTVHELATDWRIPQTVVVMAALGLIAACVSGTRRQLVYWQDSLVLFQHAVQIGPNDPLSHYNLGVSYLERGQTGKARDHFFEVIKLNPQSPEARNNLANILAMEGKSEEAVEHYKVSLQVRPNDSATEYNLALALSDLGRLEEASLHFEAALKCFPGFVQVHKDFGGVLIQRRKFEAATEHLNEYVRLQPADPEGHLFFAEALMRSGKPQAAMDHYTHALNLEPGLFERFEQAAHKLAITGRTNAAIRMYGPFVCLQTNNADLYDKFGLFLATQGRIAEAITNFNEALRLQPHPLANYHMALALLSQGNAQDAVPYYRKALDLRPNWPEALNDLAWLLATHPSTGLRDGIEAVRLAERACELSHRQEARFLGTLDAAYAEAGRFEEAIRTAEAARQVALGAQQPEIADAAAERLKLYQSKLAFRQNP